MCTAIFKNRFLSRTVDRIGCLGEHFIIGTKNYIGGAIRNDYGEVWIDGINRQGLMTALLNYKKEMNQECGCGESRIQLHPGKLVQILLENCQNVHDAMELVMSLKLTSEAPEMYPHFIIADQTGACIVFENGRVYENTFGVLTNAPSFPEQIKDCSAGTKDENSYYSSEARFRRMVQLSPKVELSHIVDCFDLLTAVTVPKGADDRPGYCTVLRTVMSADSMSYSYAAGCSGRLQSVFIGSDFVFPVSLNDDTVSHR